MKRILLLLLYTPLWLAAQQNPAAEKPKVLVYLNNFEETTKLVNDEFERTNTDEVKTKRKEAIDLFASNKTYAKIPGDTYAVAVQDNILKWMNETLREICQDVPEKYVMTDSKTQSNYPVGEYRYILKHKYVFKNGDPKKARLVFYFYDRQENKDILDSRELAGKNTYFPFFYYSGEKMYPFYTMIRSNKVKKEWAKFFRGL